MGPPPVEQEVDVATPSGAVSPQGRCGVNRALAPSKSDLKIEIGVRQRRISGRISYICTLSAPAGARLESIRLPRGKHRAACDGTRIDSCSQCIVCIWHFGLAGSQAVVPFACRESGNARTLRDFAVPGVVRVGNK